LYHLKIIASVAPNNDILAGYASRTKLPPLLQQKQASFLNSSFLAL